MGRIALLLGTARCLTNISTILALWCSTVKKQRGSKRCHHRGNTIYLSLHLSISLSPFTQSLHLFVSPSLLLPSLSHSSPPSLSLSLHISVHPHLYHSFVTFSLFESMEPCMNREKDEGEVGDDDDDDDDDDDKEEEEEEEEEGTNRGPASLPFSRCRAQRP
jgi:hypothetical protein